MRKPCSTAGSEIPKRCCEMVRDWVFLNLAENRNVVHEHMVFFPSLPIRNSRTFADSRVGSVVQRAVES